MEDRKVLTLLEGKKIRRIPLIILSLTILILNVGCLYAVRHDGPYHGKVVDQETREPIEGVVVLGTWWVYHFSPAGGYSTYYDARETVTGKNGEFVIPGEGLGILGSLEPMHFVIFKAGYKYYADHWGALKTDIPEKEEEQVKWEGDVPVFPLKKFTTEERKKLRLFPSSYPPSPPSDASLDQVKLMLNEINKERIERGVGPIDIWRGEKIWVK